MASQTPTSVTVQEEGALLHRDGDTPVVVITQEDVTDPEETTRNSGQSTKPSSSGLKRKEEWTADQSAQTPQTVIVASSGSPKVGGGYSSAGSVILTPHVTDEESSTTNRKQPLPPRSRPKSPRQDSDKQLQEVVTSTYRAGEGQSLAQVVDEGEGRVSKDDDNSNSAGSPLRVRRRTPQDGPGTQSTVAYESTSSRRRVVNDVGDDDDDKKSSPAALKSQQKKKAAQPMEPLETPSSTTTDRPSAHQQQQQLLQKVLHSPPYTPETPVQQSSYYSSNHYTTDDDMAATPSVTPIQRTAAATPSSGISSSKARRRIVVNSPKRSNSPDRTRNTTATRTTTTTTTTTTTRGGSSSRRTGVHSSSSQREAAGREAPVLMEHSVMTVNADHKASGAYPHQDSVGSGGGSGSSRSYVPNGQVPLLIQATVNTTTTTIPYEEEYNSNSYSQQQQYGGVSGLGSSPSRSSYPRRRRTSTPRMSYLPPQPLQVREVDWSTEITHEGSSPVKRRVTSKSPEKLDVSNSYNGGKPMMMVSSMDNQGGDDHPQQRDQIILTDGMQQQLLLNPKATRARHIQYQERCDVEATMLGSWAPVASASDSTTTNNAADVQNLSNATLSSPILVKSDRYRHPYVASPERDRGSMYPGGPQLLSTGFSEKEPASTFASTDERALRPHPLYSPNEHEVSPDGSPSQRYNLRSSPLKPDFLSHQYDSY